VPLLKDIPILGQLFSSSRYQKTEAELIVVLTPTIIDPLRPRAVDTMRFKTATTTPAIDALKRRLPSHQRQEGARSTESVILRRYGASGVARGSCGWPGRTGDGGSSTVRIHEIPPGGCRGCGHRASSPEAR